ncbi:hypothetical protein [Brevundimonas sp. A19_0]|uniref:hypothetical protein n=1 Tax=Brevundimonas sp. A19_0 TaxID=2821087 RepID=UPI001ADD4120|nr:hypothetical protein [Brevundimonas sp. A19_0]MBO9502516.1 hypothetical protein [Brevundimonas sp. A19_0]
MTMRYGALVGLAYAGTSATAIVTSSAHEKGTDHILIRDRVELAAAPANDTIWLGKFPSNTVLDPDGCKCWFDDLGTGVTMDVGYAGDVDALVDGQDVATAAGSFSLLKSVDISLYHEPLWKVLGMASDPGGNIELIGTLLGAASTGTVVWQMKGQTR